MDFADLTPRQLSVLNYIIEYQTRHAIAPSVREIAAGDPIEAIEQAPRELAVAGDFFGKGRFLESSPSIPV